VNECVCVCLVCIYGSSSIILFTTRHGQLGIETEAILTNDVFVFASICVCVFMCMDVYMCVDYKCQQNMKREYVFTSVRVCMCMYVYICVCVCSLPWPAHHDRERSRSRSRSLYIYFSNNMRTT
jgi:hypothetical protein